MVGAVLFSSASPAAYTATSLEHLFAASFEETLCTRLLGGAQEPLYQPASSAGDYHLLYYREDFFASALHEVAHWCIAGERRRAQVDFGYWYAPEGRTAAQQEAFEAAECKPQALEWLFSRACGYRFVLSVDNLGSVDGVLPDNTNFRQKVYQQALHWQTHGLAPRAAIFYQSLQVAFGVQCSVDTLLLRPEELT